MTDYISIGHPLNMLTATAGRPKKTARLKVLYSKGKEQDRGGSDSRMLAQGNADPHRCADSGCAAHVQLGCVSEQALQPPSQQHQGVNAMAFREESLFNFR
jgi:hypothetical protein